MVHRDQNIITALKHETYIAIRAIDNDAYIKQILRFLRQLFLPLNKIMDHSYTALWSIHMFEFGDFLNKFCRNILNVFSTFSNSLDPDQWAPIGAH